MQVKGKQKPNCPQCGQKDESKFRKFKYKKVSGEVVYYWQSWCSDCIRKKPEYQKAKFKSVKICRDRYREGYKKAFEQAGIKLECVECGYNQSWYAIDFHHRNPKEKKFNIGSMYKLKPTKARLTEVFTEIQKCDILCAICHRLVHHEINRQR